MMKKQTPDRTTGPGRTEHDAGAHSPLTSTHRTEPPPVQVLSTSESTELPRTRDGATYRAGRHFAELRWLLFQRLCRVDVDLRRKIQDTVDALYASALELTSGFEQHKKLAGAIRTMLDNFVDHLKSEAYAEQRYDMWDRVEADQRNLLESHDSPLEELDHITDIWVDDLREVFESVLDDRARQYFKLGIAIEEGRFPREVGNALLVDFNEREAKHIEQRRLKRQAEWEADGDGGGFRPKFGGKSEPWPPFGFTVAHDFDPAQRWTWLRDVKATLGALGWQLILHPPDQSQPFDQRIPPDVLRILVNKISDALLELIAPEREFSPVGYLGIGLDAKNEAVRREGYGETVQLSPLMFGLFKRICRSKSENEWTPISVLRTAWDSPGPDSIDVSDGVVRGAVSELRKYIKPLGLGIVSKRKQGYKIVAEGSDEGGPSVIGQPE